jgi:branched-chain amino acid transport system permease protein
MSSRDHTELANPFDRSSVSRRWWLLGAIVTIGLLPLVFQDSYWRTNLIVCALNVMLAIGLDFILGYAGQLNLGHSAFYGIGAYVSTLVITKLGLPFWVAFLCGIVLAGAAGMALSMFAVRLRGHYLAIASLGFAVIVHQVLVNWISLTQGPLGIYGIKPPPEIALPGLPVISFGNSANMFYLVAGFALLFYVLLDQLVRSPIGETLTAIREDEVSALTARPGKCSPSAPGRRSQARPVPSMRAPSARWFQMPSSSPSRSQSLPW